MTNKITVSFDITPDVKSVLDNLVAFSNTTPVDIFKRGVATLWMIKKGQLNGESSAMIRDGKIVAKLIGM